jgi:hypothetical protein
LRTWSIAKRLKFVAEEMAKISKKVTTNENGLGIELELKNSKAQLGDIRVVVVCE